VNTTVQTTLNLADLRQVPVVLPPKAERLAIANIADALDDKIESNRLIQGHTSDLIDALAKRVLELNDTREATLAELVEFNRLTMRPGDADSEVLYVDISSVSPGRIEAATITTWEAAPSRARRGVRDGDVIFSTVRPGRRAFAQLLDPDERIVVSTGFAVMSPTPAIGSSLLTTVAASAEFASYLESVAHGSAYPAVSVTSLGNYPIKVPADITAVAEFEATTMPLRRRAHNAEQESRALARLRDVLLPELLSGRIQVPEAREAVEEVAR
jgi:type I restriction enzyme S subunit